MKHDQDYYPAVEELEALPNMCLRLVFSNGKEGIADLSEIPVIRPHDCPWKTQEEFEEVILYNDTAAWDIGEIIVDYSPTDLYVKSGFLTWEEVNASADNDKIKIEEATDCGKNEIFIKSNTGREGYVTVNKKMSTGWKFSIPGAQKNSTIVVPWGNILWRNRWEIDAELLDSRLAKQNSYN